ncbi:hypothetical protein KSS87_021913 [Heliosperma pusillum]|nr:hypothetical protein KSS87_021913 [Heliosperma pusillum]
MYSKSLASSFPNLATLLKGRLSQRHLFQIHAQIFCYGAHHDNLIVTRLIGHYPLPVALLVFDQLQTPNIFPFNAIIRIVAEGKAQPSLAISFFKRLKQHSLFPNDFTFSFLLKACATCSNPLYVKQIHAEVTKCGLIYNSAVCNGLLVSYGKGVRDLVLALNMFNEMPDKSSIYSWICLIDGYAKSGLSEKALKLFLEMVQKKVIPDNATMVSVLSACAKLDVAGIENWVRMFKDSAKDDCLVSSTSDSVNNVLSYLYGRWGKIEESREAFDKIGDVGKRNVVAWNSIIGAYVQNGCAVEALSLFKVMIDYPYVTPNHVTMVSVLSACSQVGDIDLGIWVHEYFKSRGREDILRSNSFLATSMIDMYCKCGDLSRAKQVFLSMLTKDVISYSVMIMGLAVNGEGHEALRLFSEMLDCGSRPNGGIFLGVLCACSHSGFLEAGRQIFHDMKTKFSVSPQLEHYACYIDLLARVGRIEEALDVAKTMPFKPNNFVWGALLGGCLLHFKGKLTQDISKRLIEVDPQNSAGYVMLSNSLAHDRDWGEVSGLRRVMKDKGVKKHRGCSWISIEGIVHEFLAGHSSHPELACISSVLDGLLNEMKLPSYGVIDNEQTLP